MTIRNSSRSRMLWAGAATVALVAGTGVFAGLSAQGDESGRIVSVATETPAGSAGGLQDPVSREDASQRTEATASQIEIPAIGVDSSLEQLPLNAETGELTPPLDWLSAGWYRDGTVPGDIGPAVIAGHVDSVTAPAVFARLGELVPNDEIHVTLSNGTVSTFIVDSIATAPKDAFPTNVVYGPTPTAELRVITCDGAFDGATGHYVDNLIVFASLKA